VVLTDVLKPFAIDVKIRRPEKRRDWRSSRASSPSPLSRHTSAINNTHNGSHPSSHRGSSWRMMPTPSAIASTMTTSVTMPRAQRFARRSEEPFVKIFLRFHATSPPTMTENHAMAVAAPSSM
jgi:hypothetical protein